MSETLQGVLYGAVIGGGFTVVSVIVSAISNYFLNIRKHKSEKHLEKIEKLYETTESLYDTLMKNSTDAEKQCKELLTDLFKYGSPATVRLMSEFVRTLALKGKSVKINADVSIDNNIISCIACIALLLSQLKYDLTGIRTSPLYWFKVKLPAYSLKSFYFSVITARLVFKLRLSPLFCF